MHLLRRIGVVPGMGDGKQAEFRGLVQNTHIADIVKIYPLIIRMYFNPFETHSLDQSELFFIITHVRVDSRNGKKPGPVLGKVPLIDGLGKPDNGIKLLYIGDSRKNYTGVNSRSSHRIQKAVCGAVGAGGDMYHISQFWDCLFCYFFRENVSVKINDHGCNCPFFIVSILEAGGNINRAARVLAIR